MWALRMCGRFAISASAEELADEFGVPIENIHDRIEPRWNVAPTDQVYAVMERQPRDDPGALPRRRLTTARWGLIPSWAKSIAVGSRMINARIETVTSKPAYRRAAALRRCLIPADGFYEWRPNQGKKQPFYIHPAHGTLAMAGLYEIWRDRERPADDPDAFVWSATIVTTDAVDDVGHIHDRMPMLVAPEQWDMWLDPENHAAEEVLNVLEPGVPGVLDAYPVSMDVNKVANDGPHLVDPVQL